METFNECMIQILRKYGVAANKKLERELGKLMTDYANDCLAEVKLKLLKAEDEANIPPVPHDKLTKSDSRWLYFKSHIEMAKHLVFLIGEKRLGELAAAPDMQNMLFRVCCDKSLKKEDLYNSKS